MSAFCRGCCAALMNRRRRLNVVSVRPWRHALRRCENFVSTKASIPICSRGLVPRSKSSSKRSPMMARFSSVQSAAPRAFQRRYGSTLLDAARTSKLQLSHISTNSRMPLPHNTVLSPHGPPGFRLRRSRAFCLESTRSKIILGVLLTPTPLHTTSSIHSHLSSQRWHVKRTNRAAFFSGVVRTQSQVLVTSSVMRRNT